MVQRILPLLFALSFLTPALRAAEEPPPRHLSIYVDAAATGPGDGTPADPFPTFAQAFALAIPHDYVIVRPGVYHEALTVPFFILVRSEQGPESTIIDASGLPGTHAVVLDTLAELSGFTVTKSDGGGILASTTPGNPEFGRILRGARVVDCGGPGLELAGPTHPVITDCVFAGNAQAGVLLTGGASPFFTGNSLTLNAVGIDSFSSTPDGQAAFANSILWGNAVEATGLAPTAFIACDLGDPALATANASFSIDPLFRDPLVHDLRLAYGSPCIDATNAAYVPFSSTFDNRGYGWLRKSASTPGGPQLADVGAFERGGLATWPRLPSSSDTLRLELATGAGTQWFLFSGEPNQNPSFPIPSASGFLFLETNPLILQLEGVQDAGGRTELVLPLVPGLSGRSFWLQALAIDFNSAPIGYALTNLESVIID